MIYDTTTTTTKTLNKLKAHCVCFSTERLDSFYINLFICCNPNFINKKGCKGTWINKSKVYMEDEL